MKHPTIAALQARIAELEADYKRMSTECAALYVQQRPSRSVVADTHNKVVSIRGKRFEKVPSTVGGRTVFTYKELA